MSDSSIVGSIEAAPADPLREVGRHHLTIRSCGEVEALVFEGNSELSWIVAIIVGTLARAEAPLVRLHSRCLYGEVLGSMDCDCRAQLDMAFEKMAREGSGVFLYLEQEGRGAGLLSKAKAYVLKETNGLDTVAAYRELDLPLDQRHYTAAAFVLRRLGLERVRLLTNNPAKLDGLTKANIEVEQVLLQTTPTPQDIEYLRVKQFKLGQNLGLPTE